jgi:hypothetical protein
MTSQPPRPPDWWQQGQQSQPAQPGGPDGFGPPHQQQPYQQQPDPIGDPQQWAGPPRPPERGHGGRTAAAVVGLIAVAVLGSAGGYWLGHRDDGSSDTTSAPVVTTTPGTSSAGASPAASPSPRTSPTKARKVPLADVAQVDAADARTQVRQAGLPVQGKGVEAWGWTDTNGRNLLLATKVVDKTEAGVVRAATLHVYHVAGLGSRPKMMLTPLRDPGVPDCDVDFGLDFVPGSIRVSDTDGDGYGEATVGWWSLCAGDPEPERIKLALVTKGTYYILRGTGQRASDPPPPDGITFPKASFTPSLHASKWPAGSYQATVELFHTLFR